MADPTGSAVQVHGGVPARFAQLVDQSEERSLRLGEVADFREPVVLLGVNVQVKVVGPAHAGCKTVVPNSLKCQRKR